MLYDLSMKQFLDVLASSSPAPGGGSVSAASGAMAGSLLSMVCLLSQKRPELAAHEGLHVDTLARARSLTEELTGLIEKDTQAFNEVMAAFKLPKTTDAEKTARSAAIQKGYLVAIRVPLLTAVCCVEIAELAMPISEACNTNAASDLGVCVACARAGMEGALMNVRINLTSLKDSEQAEAIQHEAQSYEARMEQAVQHTQRTLGQYVC